MQRSSKKYSYRLLGFLIILMRVFLSYQFNFKFFAPPMHEVATDLSFTNMLLLTLGLMIIHITGSILSYKMAKRLHRNVIAAAFWGIAFPGLTLIYYSYAKKAVAQRNNNSV